MYVNTEVEKQVKNEASYRGCGKRIVWRSHGIAMTIAVRLFAIVLLLISVCAAAQARAAQDLFAAAKSGDLQEARNLLETGADVNATDGITLTALHYAAGMGHKELVELIMGKGGDINARTDEGVTPLYLAAKFDRAAVAKVLVDQGAEVDVKALSGWTPLVMAAINGNLEIAALLLDRGAGINSRDTKDRQPLIHAVKGLYLGWILKSSSPLAVELRKRLRREEEEQIRHARGQWREVVMLLIGRGSDVNTAAADEAPLELAATMGDRGLVDALIDKGADVNGARNSYETPLHAAIAERWADIAVLLIKKGANVNALNRSGRTPLHFLGMYIDDGELADLMIKHGANVNPADRYGATPLSYASKAGHVKTAEALRLKGGE